MKKNNFLVIALLLSLVWLSSCVKDETVKLDPEWRAFQDDVYDRVGAYKDESGDLVYKALKSESGAGRVYWKSSDFITKRMMGDFEQEEPVIFPKSIQVVNEPIKPTYITDSVVVRYQGWYLDKEDKFVVFDTTEDTNNVATAGFSVGGVVDGFRTILMDMTVNEERIVCIPQTMGYGANTSTSIPPYTTLFFDVKLLEIYSGDGELLAPQ